MKTTINNDYGDFKIDEKRLRLPIVLSSHCPHCGLIIDRDFEVDYFSYPRVGYPMTITMYHFDEDTNEDHEWDVTVQLDVQLSLVDEG